MDSIKKKLRGKSDFEQRFNNDDFLFRSYVLSIMEKHKDGVPLSPQEITDLCMFTTKEYHTSLPICRDELFQRDFRDFYYNRSSKASAAEIKLMEEYYKDWHEVVYKNNLGATVLSKVCKETRDVIAELKSSETTNSDEHIFETILFSRYVYILIAKIFSGQHTHIEIEHDDKIIHIDASTLSHCIIKHFAPDLKKFGVKKSYIKDQIHPDQLHEHLELIIKQAINSGALIAGQLDFKFQYLNVPYQIYFRLKGASSRERGQYQVMRLNTFYPIENSHELAKLDSLSLRKINDNLYIYSNQ